MTAAHIAPITGACASPFFLFVMQMARTVTYFPLKMLDGWHVKYRVEYDPPVEIHDIGVVFDSKLEALEEIASITRSDDDGNDKTS